MRLKLYCNRFGHFKDALVCSVNCAYRTRCKDFALFYDEHRENVDSLVADYYEAQRATPAPAAPEAAARQSHSRTLPIAPVPFTRVARAVDMRELIRLEVKREMAESVFIWIDKDGRAELLEHNEIIKRATRGQKPQTIYKVSQEMELKFQLVPRKRIERARLAADAEQERADARRAARRTTPAPLAVVAAPAEEPAESAPAPRRARRRAA
jgi:hypothetical protein